MANAPNHEALLHLSRNPLAVSRRKAREQAVQILYQIDFTKQPSKDAVPLFLSHFSPSRKSDEFTVRLVQGVEAQEKAIDGILRQYSEHWSLERMSRIDRTILRIAIFEILWCVDIPPKVSINEAIELGKKFSTDKSALFINGVLDKVTHSEG